MTNTALNTGKNHKKKQLLRNNEYYNIQELFDELYARSLKGYKFNKLYDLIVKRENILLAYRNIKKEYRQ